MFFQNIHNNSFGGLDIKYKYSLIPTSLHDCLINNGICSNVSPPLSCLYFAICLFRIDHSPYSYIRPKFCYHRGATADVTADQSPLPISGPTFH